MNKWGVMKVAGDEMKELDVNVPRFCWLVVDGGVDWMTHGVTKTIGFP